MANANSTGRKATRPAAKVIPLAGRDEQPHAPAPDFKIYSPSTALFRVQGVLYCVGQAIQDLSQLSDETERGRVVEISSHIEQAIALAFDMAMLGSGEIDGIAHAPGMVGD